MSDPDEGTSADTGSGGPVGRDIDVGSPPDTDFEDMAGLERRKRRLRESIIDPAVTDRHTMLGADSILLHGPAGVGKTHLSEALIGELGFDRIDVAPKDLPLENSDRTAELIDELTEFALSQSPCVLVFDSFDVIAPADDEGEFGRPTQIGSALRSALDTIDTSEANVIVIAVARQLGDVERTVRRSGRIDIVMKLDDRGQQRRHQLFLNELDSISDRLDGLEIAHSEIDLDLCIELTSGFVAAEIISIVQRAAQIAFADAPGADAILTQSDLLTACEEVAQRKEQRECPNRSPSADASDSQIRSQGESADSDSRTETNDSIDPSEGQNVPADDTQAEQKPRGSAHQDPQSRAEEDAQVPIDSPVGSVTVPEVTYDDIGGLDEAKQRLREVVEWPQKCPDLFDQLDIDPPTGILLHGPPGTGKTMLAKAAAYESDRNFISISGPEIFDKHFGESERLVRDLFDAAREAAPSMIFFDEFDSIAGRRGGYSAGSELKDSIVNQLLSELDGMNELGDVVVLGATNRVDMIDPAVRRPGRFGLEIEVPLPDPTGRREIFDVHLQNRSIADDVDLAWLVSMTDEGYTGADIASICQQAAMEALRSTVDAYDSATPQDTPLISREDFQQALEHVAPSGPSQHSEDSGTGAFW
jgi:SpoVK/Ycf46/Vps4 family AAA+-type ATPase